MKRVLREPLVHFLLLGAALFGLYAVVNPGAESKPGEIVVTAGQIENLTATFAKVWQRPPTAAELKEQIDQYVKEEILSREAIKLGLNENDAVIRRRLQQKMEFLAEDFAGATEPTDAELADYLAQHPEAFVREPRFTFRHVFLSEDKHRGQLRTDAMALLAKLKPLGSKADVRALGDSLMRPHEFVDEPQHGVTSQFGQEFAAGLAKTKVGEWTGPIQSGYGLHLVFVTRRVEGRLPALEEVREQVKRELANTRRLAANRKLLEALSAKYRVTIQWPKEAPVPAAGGPH